ncbi:MAG: WHG domain-containing protein [Bryobacteraceae bacterium]|nr:WHG domain-containing protein [Bryobacteraceae bacterium]
MASAKKTKPYHHGALRPSLLAAARARLERNGLETLSLRELARQAGVSPNAPYRHFQDKTDLLAALAEEGFRELTKEFQACGSFAEMGAAYVEFALRNPNLLRLMFGNPLGTAESYPGLAAASRECFGMLLDGAARTVNLPPSHPQSFQFALASWSLVHGFATLRNDGALAHLPPEGMPTAAELTRCLAPPAAPVRPKPKRVRAKSRDRAAGPAT